MSIVEICPQLCYIDGSGGGKVSAIIAAGVLYNGRNLRAFKVEPATGHEGFWMQLLWQYKESVMFGSCITDKLPVREASLKEYQKLIANEE